MQQNESPIIPLTPQYFLNKLTQDRKKIEGDINQLASHALDLAGLTRQLCYPLPIILKTALYYNNAPFTPYLLAEHPGLEVEGVQYGTPEMKEAARQTSVPIKDYVVIDVHYFFDRPRQVKKLEDSFVVEVAFPQGTQRARWNLIRVRWCDLGWSKRGNHCNDVPIPCLCGETYANNWA
jgi:hypothetical protein